MKIIKEGHEYQLSSHDGSLLGGGRLQFVDKTDPEDIKDGTTTEDVIDVVINRLNVLNNRFPCNENAAAIHHLQEARKMLDKRTEDRKKRQVEGKQLA